MRRATEKFNAFELGILREVFSNASIDDIIVDWKSFQSTSDAKILKDTMKTMAKSIERAAYKPGTNFEKEVISYSYEYLDLGVEQGQVIDALGNLRWSIEKTLDAKLQPEKYNRTLNKVFRKITKGMNFVYSLDQTLAVSRELMKNKDLETDSHLQRTATFVHYIAKEFGYGKNIFYLSQFHDIGKVGIPDSILLKPGPLSPAEKEEMKTHVYKGEKTISLIKGPKGAQDDIDMAREIALYHHPEYFPDINMKDIPFHARIFAVVDVYDALRSKRPYRDALTHNQALDVMLKENMNKLDDKVLECFTDSIDYIRRISEQYEEKSVKRLSVV